MSVGDEKIWLLECLDRSLQMPLRRILCSEVAPLPPGDWVRPQNYNCVRVSLMLSGHSSICIQHNGLWRETAIEAGEALIFTPLSWTAFSSDTEHLMENLGLVLNPDFLRLIYVGAKNEHAKREMHSFHIGDTLRASTAGILNLLPMVFQSGDTEDTARTLLRQALRQIRSDLAAAAESERGNTSNLWKQICAHLTENFTQIRSRDEVADRFGISTGYLSNLFSLYGHGMTFNQTLNRLRLESAARQLATGKASCENISGNCGFQSPSYFGMRFRRRYHCTPLEYRNAHRKNQ